MVKRGVALALACLMLVATALAEPFDDAVVDSLFRNGQTVGAALVVTHHGEVVYEHYYGYANKAKKEPVTADTYFRLASVTKMVTGVGVMRLVESGKLKLDEAIGEWLGIPVVNPRHQDIPVTLRHLLTHTAGLNDNGGYSILSKRLSTLFERKESYKTFLNEAPGSRYRYSNFGAGIVGSLIEAATGMELHAYMAENVFAPMGIDAGYAAKLLKHPENISAQYKNGEMATSAAAALEKKYELTPDPDNHYRINSGALWASARDLSKVLIMLSSEGEYEGVRLLAQESVREMMEYQAEKPNMSAAHLPYGLAVERVTSLVPGKTIYGHQGRGVDFICNAYFDAENEWTFVMLTNGCAMLQENHIGHLSRTLFDYCYGLMEPSL